MAICQMWTSVHRIVCSGGAVSEFGIHRQAGCLNASVDISTAPARQVRLPSIACEVHLKGQLVNVDMTQPPHLSANAAVSLARIIDL